MSDERQHDAQGEAPAERDARYAERIAEHSHWPIGDTNVGTGGLKPTDDIGTGGTADVAGARDFGDTSSIRTGQIGIGGVLGSRLGDTGPGTGAGGPSQAERGGLDALAERPVTGTAERDASASETSASGARERGSAAAGGDGGARERAEGRIDLSAGGGLNAAAVQASGLAGAGLHGEAATPPGTDDLGAAQGTDLGAGLGQTRGSSRQNPRGQITGAGGTRGSGAGTGHLEDSPG